MNMRKFYKKYGKRTLAAFLSVLLLVQTPLLSYADNIDNAISSYDEITNRPVWDESYSVDDSKEFDPSVIGMGANRIEDIQSLELEPLSEEQVASYFEHENDEIEIPEIATDSNSTLINYDNEIEPQLAVAVAAGVGVITLILATLFSSALSLNTPGESVYKQIKDLANSSSYVKYRGLDSSGKYSYIYVYPAMAKVFLDKLDNSRTGSTYNISMTEDDKRVLEYALSENNLLSNLNPKNVNVKAVDGYKYYYIIGVNMHDKTNCYVWYTKDKVAYACWNPAGDNIKLYRYNPLLASDSKFETMPYAESTYMLSNATGMYELASTTTYDGIEHGSSMYDYGTDASRCLPFTIIYSQSYRTDVENYFTLQSALLLNRSLNGRVVSHDDIMDATSFSGTIDNILSSDKNVYAQVTGVNKAAGKITEASSGTGTGSSTKVTLTAAQAYACIKYLLNALASNAGTAIGASSMYSFISDFYDNNIGGSASNASDMSLVIINKYVTITGGGANGTYDTKVENNKYKLAETLAVAFGKFMVDSKLISAAPDYTKNPAITNNITVAVPGATTKPGENTGTTAPGGGSGNTGGSTASPDYSGSLTSIIGIITTISTAVTSIPNIFTLFQALPTTIKDSLVNAVADIPFFGKAITYLASLVSAVDNIAHWEIDNWAEYSAAMLASSRSIDNLKDLVGSISNFYTDNYPDVLADALANIPGFDVLVNTANVLKVWNIDTVGETMVASINNVLTKLGLATIPDKIASFKDSVDSKLIESAALLVAIKDALGSLSLGIDLSGLSDTIKNALTALGLASLLGKVAEIGEAVKSISFADIIAAIKALPISIAAEIAKVIPSQEKSDNENQNDSGFKNFLNLFIVTILILIILIVLFINCLRFIVLVFNIPASTTLLPDDVLTGIQYLKDLQLPMFGVSLYTLLLSCAYFIIFMTVIMTLRRKIDKIHI